MYHGKCLELLKARHLTSRDAKTQAGSNFELNSTAYELLGDRMPDEIDLFAKGEGE